MSLAYWYEKAGLFPAQRILDCVSGKRRQGSMLPLLLSDVMGGVWPATPGSWCLDFPVTWNCELPWTVPPKVLLSEYYMTAAGGETETPPFHSSPSVSKGSVLRSPWFAVFSAQDSLGVNSHHCLFLASRASCSCHVPGAHGGGDVPHERFRPELGIL